MALIKSTILAQISGSINGTTFAHNRGGAYARNRSLPINPGTDRQDQVRTSLASLANAWRDTLTEPERALWRAYGGATQVVNRVGDTVTLTGIAAFQRVNMFRLSSLGMAMVSTPPASGLNPNPPPSFVGAVLSQAMGQHPDLTLNLANAPATGYGLLIYYSGPISPGKAWYRGPWLTHTTAAITSNNPLVPLNALPDDDTYEGMKVGARVTCYDTTSSLPIWTVFLDPMTLPEPAP